MYFYGQLGISGGMSRAKYIRIQQELELLPLALWLLFFATL